MKKGDRKPGQTGTPWLEVTCDVIKGGAFAAACCVLLLFLCAVLITRGVIGEDCADAAVLFICVISAAAGGSVTMHRIRQRTLPTGVSVGFVLFLLLLTAGMLTIHSGFSQEQGGAILFACLVGGALSAFPGRKQKKKRRR